MDINHILSLLKNGAEHHDEQPSTHAPSSTPSFNLPSSVDLAAIDPDVIQQVRQEYWATQQQQPSVPPPQQQQSRETHDDDKDSLNALLDSIQGATRINSKVLMALGRLTKETNVIAILQGCKESQHRKENELYQQRQELVQQHQKKRDALFAKELVGASVDWESLEKQSEKELKQMDTHIVHEMDREIRSQQAKLAKLRVPFFKVTSSMDDIKMQHKVLSILQDMI
ncbi:hypothetical protein K492DRAFT_154700, partial [Lichtheimia hyalospora FSU 10163]